MQYRPHFDILSIFGFTVTTNIDAISIRYRPHFDMVSIFNLIVAGHTVQEHPRVSRVQIRMACSGLVFFGLFVTTTRRRLLFVVSGRRFFSLTKVHMLASREGCCAIHAG